MDPHYRDMGTENELAVVLSNYNSNFVYHIVHYQIDRAISGEANTINTPPNVVGAW